MKKQSLPALCALSSAIALLSFSGCSKITDLLNKNLEMRTTSVDFVIPPALDTNITASGTQSNSYNVDSFIKASTGNALGVSNINSAKLKACVIRINNATAAINFQNFKTFSGAFHTDANTADYALSIVNNPNTYRDTLSLPVDTTQELKQYLTSNRFTYRVSGSLRKPVLDTVHCTATFTFSVKVQN